MVETHYRYPSVPIYFPLVQQRVKISPDSKKGNRTDTSKYKLYNIGTLLLLLSGGTTRLFSLFPSKHVNHGPHKAPKQLGPCLSWLVWIIAIPQQQNILLNVLYKLDHGLLDPIGKFVNMRMQDTPPFRSGCGLDKGQ